ncbi:hypothetical protein M758_7G180000 [Ceratodon purpureus]|nr:hypothetical protein M758_7G180000 [Ceratodon purpureus]
MLSEPSMPAKQISLQCSLPLSLSPCSEEEPGNDVLMAFLYLLQSGFFTSHFHMPNPLFIPHHKCGAPMPKPYTTYCSALHYTKPSVIVKYYHRLLAAWARFT